ncbi:hypothetical protein, partial [Streptomyces adustus]
TQAGPEDAVQRGASAWAALSVPPGRGGYRARPGESARDVTVPGALRCSVPSAGYFATNWVRIAWTS